MTDHELTLSLSLSLSLVLRLHDLDSISSSRRTLLLATRDDVTRGSGIFGILSVHLLMEDIPISRIFRIFLSFLQFAICKFNVGDVQGANLIEQTEQIFKFPSFRIQAC